MPKKPEGKELAVASNPIKASIVGGLRSIAASIPVAGSIGQAWSEYDSFRTGQRIDELFNSVRLELESLKQRQQLHEKQIESTRDEVPSLVEIAVEKVRREFSDEKRGLYARLLARLVNAGGTLTYDQKVSLLYEFDALTVNDVGALELFPPKNGVHVSELNGTSLKLPGNATEQFGEFVSILAKLESRGLIGTTSTGRSMDMTSSVGDPASWQNRWRNRVLGILPAGERLRTLLKK